MAPKNASDLFTVPLSEVARAAHQELLSYDLEDIAEDDHAEIIFHTISPGSAGQYQVEAAREFFGLPVPDDWEGDPEDYDPTEDEWAWEDVEQAADKVATAMNRAAPADVFGSFYFGHNPHHGDYGLMYGADVEDVEEALPAAREGGWAAYRHQRRGQE